MTRVTAVSLAKDIDRFLVFKRALGHPYQRGEAALRSLQRFAARNLDRNTTIDLAAVTGAWLARVPNRKPVTLACDLGAVRQLCHFRRRRDPKGYLPSVRLAPQTESHYVPHIFSAEEIRALVEAAGRHQGRNFWPGLLRLLILTAYCTGLRFGEAVRLRCVDVDLPSRVLHIRASKGRSRLVPFGSDLARGSTGRNVTRFFWAREAVAAMPFSLDVMGARLRWVAPQMPCVISFASWA